METIKILMHSLRCMLRKPSMYIYIAIPLIGLVLIDTFWIPIASLVSYITMFMQGNVLATIVTMLKFLVQPMSLLAFLAIVIVFLIIVSFVISFFFIGVFGKLNRDVNNKKGEPNKYGWYFRKYYLKTVWTFMRTGTLLFFLIMAILVFLVPAIVISTTAYTKGGGWVPVAVFVDAITVATMFLVLYYVKMYLVFWFPSMMLHKRSFKAARLIVNRNFWKMVYVFVIADICILLGMIITIVSLTRRESSFFSYPMILLGLAIVDVTIIAFFSYVFNAYKFYVDKYRNSPEGIKKKKRSRKQMQDPDMYG